MAWIESNPGASLQELADALGVTRTAANYHVRRLVRSGTVRQVRQGRRVLHFGPVRNTPLRDTVMAALRQQRVRELLQMLMQDPTASWRELAAALDVTPRAVRWHVRRLEEEGLIEVHEVGVRAHHVGLHPEVANELRQWATTQDVPAMEVAPA